jgi:hypothetical protein
VIVAAHQPHLMPWLGYLHKMVCADLFVIMDDLQFTEQNFQNRQRVRTNGGAHWLTVPLHRGAQTDRICDKRINNEASPRQHWQRRGWLTIENNYRKAPFFATYAAELRETFLRPWDRLVDLDAAMLDLARAWFGITTPLVRSSELELEGHESARILSMCRRLGADTYLSGGGGSTDYLDVELLRRGGVALAWQRFQHPTYSQRYPELGFTSHLGFIDFLFNCGPCDLHTFTASPPNHERAAS